MIAPRTPRRQKRESDYWLEAAERVVSGHCFYLCWRIKNQFPAALKESAFERIDRFNPYDEDAEISGNPADWTWAFSDTEQRVIAALLMHEMAKDDEPSEAP